MVMVVNDDGCYIMVVIPTSGHLAVKHIIIPVFEKKGK